MSEWKLTLALRGGFVELGGGDAFLSLGDAAVHLLLHLTDAMLRSLLRQSPRLPNLLLGSPRRLRSRRLELCGFALNLRA